MSTYQPYTYLVKHVPTNRFYYGVRWKNVKLKLTPEEDLWVSYFTRSNKIKKLIETYGVESFRIQVRRRFNTITQARDWESKVLRRMKVLSKPDVWLNRTDNKAILNDCHPRGTLGKTWKNPTASIRNKIEKKGNDYTKNTRWVHNGKERKMIPCGTLLPDGFVYGTGRTNKRPDLSERNRRQGKREEKK